MSDYNRYYVYIGGNIGTIRQILNLTQDELASMMGVSRPTLIKLEQNPDKMTKALAFALFGATAIEVKKRLRSISKINPQDYKDIEKVGALVENLKSSAALSVSGIGIVAAKGLGGLVPGIGSLVSTGLKNGWKSLKEKAVSDLKENVHWDIDKTQKIIESVERKLLEDEKKILECFKLDSFDIEQFGEEIAKGEDSDYDLWGGDNVKRF